MKFGGSSLANPQRIRNACEIIKSRLKKKPIVVLSALGKTTDNLLSAGNDALGGKVHIRQIRDFHLGLAKELKADKKEVESLLSELENLLKGISLTKGLTPETEDFLVSFGERLAVRIVAGYLNSTGIKVKHFDAWDAGFLSDSNFMNAKLKNETYAAVRRKFAHLKKKYKYTPIVTGFIAKDEDGNITTLGRGGSDLTASVIGSAIKADAIEIWKDVDGLLTTDPRMVKKARHVRKVSFEEASELAYFGAKIFHPYSILPAMSANVPVIVKNYFKPREEGTIVLKKFKNKSSELTGISFKRNIVVVDIYSTRMLGQSGFVSKVFEQFGDLDISIDLIATSEVDIAVTVGQSEKLNELEKRFSGFGKIRIWKKMASISLVGDIRNGKNILKRAFIALSRIHVFPEMISHGASQVSTSIVVDDKNLEKCVRVLHKEFLEHK